MCLLNIFYLKCILTGMDVSGLSPGYPLTLEPPLHLPYLLAANLVTVHSVSGSYLRQIVPVTSILEGWSHGLMVRESDS